MNQQFQEEMEIQVEEEEEMEMGLLKNLLLFLGFGRNRVAAVVNKKEIVVLLMVQDG